MKTCKVCKEEKSSVEFTKYQHSKDGLHTMCRPCLAEHKAKDYKEKWFIYQARLKKAECKKKGLPFDITPEYLESIWTDECPIYKVPFVRFDKGHPHSPSLDRMDPDKGYVKGNLTYISSRANRIKYDATVEELRLILDFMEGATTISKESTPKRVEAPDPTEDSK